jgi:hypothetical protein
MIFTYLFVLIFRLCSAYFVVPSLCVVLCCPVFVRSILLSVFVRRSFVSGWRINFDLVQIQLMSILMSSMLQIQRHGYSEHFNMVIFIGLCNLPFHAINMDTVSLFADLCFLFLANFKKNNNTPIRHAAFCSVIFLIILMFFKNKYYNIIFLLY